MNLYLDIETIGTEDPAVIAEIAAGIAPPRTMSKPETIAKWEAEEKPALVDEAVRRTAFDGGLGRVICIGTALDTGPAGATIGLDEKLLLGALKSPQGTVRVIGHNVGWDIRFLWQRFIVHALPVPTWLAQAVRAKPWELADTMAMWNPERDRKVSLDRLCKILGVPTSKGEMDGSKVWDAWKAGEHGKIAAYCRADVEAMRACYQRMAA